MSSTTQSSPQTQTTSKSRQTTFSSAPGTSKNAKSISSKIPVASHTSTSTSIKHLLNNFNQAANNNSTTSSITDSNNSNSGSLSSGVITGIVLGAILALLAILVYVLTFRRHRKEKLRKAQELNERNEALDNERHREQQLLHDEQQRIQADRIELRELVMEPNEFSGQSSGLSGLRGRTALSEQNNKLTEQKNELSGRNNELSERNELLSVNANKTEINYNTSQHPQQQPPTPSSSPPPLQHQQQQQQQQQPKQSLFSAAIARMRPHTPHLATTQLSQPQPPLPSSSSSSSPHLDPLLEQKIELMSADVDVKDKKGKGRFTGVEMDAPRRQELISIMLKIPDDPKRWSVTHVGIWVAYSCRVGNGGNGNGNDGLETSMGEEEVRKIVGAQGITGATLLKMGMPELMGLFKMDKDPDMHNKLRSAILDLRYYVDEKEIRESLL
ncbi:hypothetical protein HK100_011744 [Physocladia obscura]|uniref:Uncharacterized protein n=1 Tax=Physocladia obscura TaxID=109957 RepID=A0AAD5T2G9_9FUNG|nr:hypothetical protein HK100_011744 [Physocladia obscura]